MTTPLRRTTFDVRVWAVREMKNRTSVSWQVRWQVSGRVHPKTGKPWPNSRRFPTFEAARARHAEITLAVKKGEAFDVESGLPVFELRRQPAPAVVVPVAPSWLAVARDFVDAKWAQGQAPATRQSIADGLAAVSLALFDEDAPARLAELRREALSIWMFNTALRAADPPPGWVEVIGWMEAHSRPVTDLTVDDVLHGALATTGLLINGRRAAANTTIRRRTIFAMAVKFAVARGDLDHNPLTDTSWKTPRTVTQVDRRVVVNHRQARRLLAAVAEREPALAAWYGCIYYAAMRPSEVSELRITQIILPETGWGEAEIEWNNPDVPAHWGDAGERAHRELKHRARGETRLVPLHPLLVALLRRHLARFGTAPDGRIFRGADDRQIGTTHYLKVWADVRKAVFTAAEVASPLARTPYDLRHACVSTWLNAGVPPTEIAAWAGHSVQVLLAVYAKCIVGQGAAARRRIDAAFAEDQLDDEDKP